MKRSELLVSTLLVPLDALAIFGAFALSYYVRVESGALPVSFVFPEERFYFIAAGITTIWLVVFALLGLYKLRSTRRGLSELSRIAAGVTIGTMVVIAIIFFARINFFSRLVIVFAFVAALIMVSLLRLLVQALQRGLFRYGIGVRRTIIVGTGDTAQTLQRELSKSSRGYKILGVVGMRDQPVADQQIGTLDDIESVLNRLLPDELIDAESRLTPEQRLELLNLAEDRHIDFRFATSTAALATSRVQATAIAGIPLLTVIRTPLEGWGRVAKRIIDIIGALVALPFILLLFPFIAAVIKLNSKGPVLFKQTRVGKEGEQFVSYKFRSMVPDAEAKRSKLQAKNEASGPVFKIKDDPRVTGVGRFLRRSSIDELPQFFNVLKGDMSLVGPRPPLPSEVAQYTREQRRRLTIKPGITGPWQVSGRSDVSFDEWVRLDVYYIQNWSMLLDLTILLKTFKAVISRRGAY